MTKYYLATYSYRYNGFNIRRDLIQVTDKSLSEIEKDIAKDLGLDNSVVILFLKDLSKDEFNMLKGECDKN